VDGTGIGVCPTVVFDISGVEAWGSATRASLSFDFIAWKDLGCTRKI
jgi:hypothetical protein